MKQTRKFPGPKAARKDVTASIDEMEKAMEKIAKEQDLPTLRPVSVQTVLEVLNKRHGFQEDSLDK